MADAGKPYLSPFSIEVEGQIIRANFHTLEDVMSFAQWVEHEFPGHRVEAFDLQHQRVFSSATKLLKSTRWKL